MDYQKESINLHKKFGGKLEVKSKVSVSSKEDLSLAYSPGVAGPALAIAKDKSKVRELTWRKNTIAIISDGSAVLGLGNIGPEAGLPIMEGKAVLFKEFADVDAIPIVVDTQDVDEFVNTVVNIAPSFSGINLEDISAPRCFEIEKQLSEKLDIPVFHDDQHGTAIVLLAALINAEKITDYDVSTAKVVINGAGAAGIASANLLYEYGYRNILLCDSKGIVSTAREDLNEYKKMMLSITNPQDVQGDLAAAVADAKIFIGLSVAGALSPEMVKSMEKDPIILAMANPTPEIMPDEAKSAGAFIVATGRSDFPNQVNNVLGFPGIFRGLLDKKINRVTIEMKLRAAKAIAELVESPNPENIIPSPLNKEVAPAVAAAI